MKKVITSLVFVLALGSTFSLDYSLVQAQACSREFPNGTCPTSQRCQVISMGADDLGEFACVDIEGVTGCGRNYPEGCPGNTECASIGQGEFTCVDPNHPLLGGPNPNDLPYIPLEPLPGVDQTGQADFGDLIAGFFRILINLGAFAAVTVLVIGGITYMVSEKSFSKLMAKERIKAALWGLAILAGAWLILYTINPQLISFTLDRNTVEVGPPPEFRPDQLILSKEQMATSLKYYAERNGWLPENMYFVRGGFLFNKAVEKNKTVITLRGNLQEECSNSDINFASLAWESIVSFAKGNIQYSLSNPTKQILEKGIRAKLSRIEILPGEAVGFPPDYSVEICMTYNVQVPL